MPREELRCLKCRTSKAKCIPGRPPWPSEPCERCRKYNYTCSPRTYKHSQQGSVTMDEVEPARTTDPFQGAGPSNINIEPTMMLTPGDVLAPTLNSYVDQTIDTRVNTQSELYEQTTQLIEDLSCLRFLWQDLTHFEHLRSEYGLARTFEHSKLRNVDLFFDNFKASYKSAIARAQNHLDLLRADYHRLGMLALLNQISFAWQPFNNPDQSLDELEALIRAHEIAGESITALVLQELLLSKYSLNALSAEAAAASEHLLDLYDIFLNVVARVALRLDLDVDICISIAPILHRVVRLDHLYLFNTALRRGADLVLQDYLCRTVVHVAAECNAVHVLKEFSVSILKEDSLEMFMRFPLLLAVQSKNTTIVRHLLSVQATRRRDNETMCDLMTAAVGTGLADVVRLLLVKGNFCSAGNDPRVIGLKLAASKGSLEIVRLLTIAGAEQNDTEISLDSSSRAKTALCYAAEAGHLEVVRDLLESKANVSARSGDSGMAPLHGAAVNGHYNIVRMLLWSGANVNDQALVKRAAMKRRASALELASAQGHVRIVRLLLASSSRTSQALNAAARNGHLGVVNVFLETDADVEDLNHTGTTTLVEAVSSGHLSVVQRLLQARVDVGAPSQRIFFTRYRFCTPLHVAAGNGLIDIVQALVYAGGNINATNTRNKDREDPNEQSQNSEEQAEDVFNKWDMPSNEQFDEEFIEEYDDAFERGFSAEFWHEYENEGLDAHYYINTVTPLLLAAGRGHTQTVQLLISAGANVHATPGRCNTTALCAAASAGHLSTVQVLLEANADVNARAKALWGMTALQGASEGGHVLVARLLVGANADVNAPGCELGRTALQLAAVEGHLQIVQLLMDAGADVKTRPNFLATPVQNAAMSGNVDIVRSLLQAGAVVDVDPTNPHERTALQRAAEHGHLEVVELLLDAHANFTFTHAHGLAAALQGAAKCGRVELVRVLLDAKADVNGSKHGMTPLQYAAGANHENIVKLLMTAGADLNALPEDLQEGETALTIAVCKGHYNMAKQLLAFGADVNRRGMNRPSALERALQGATSGASVELVNVLLDAEADVNACSGPQGQNSPLGAAASSGDIAMVQKLLTANADVNLGNPLAAAARYGFVDIVRLLLSRQADVNSMKGNDHSNGKPALVSAAQCDHLEMVQVLVEAGTNLDIIERALSKAAHHGHLEIVQALLRKEPDPNALHATCFSALREAAANGHLEILRVLLLAGADPNASTSLCHLEDSTALEVAVYHGHLAAVRLLLYAGADENPPPSAYYGLQTLLQLAEFSRDHEILQLLEDANTRGCRDDSRKRKRKKKAVELDETSSSE